MDETVQQHMMSGVYAIISLLVISMIIQVYHQSTFQKVLPKGTQISLNDTIQGSSNKKVEMIVKTTTLKLYQDFNPLDYLEIINGPTQNIDQFLKVYGYVDTKHKGLYKITYVLEYHGMINRKETTFVVD